MLDKPSYRLGADIGGTFTDLVLLDGASERVTLLKLRSDPRHPAAVVREGVEQILTAVGANASDLGMFIHGTTVALNTLIQRSGAQVGLIITDGFRDLLELRRLRLKEPQNFYADRPQPLVPRRLVREVSERMLADGSVYVPLSKDEVADAARWLADQGCSAIAVCFLHAYANGAHEQAARKTVEESSPGVYVCTSHEVWPQWREYERSSATVINAHVGARMRAYFAQLEGDLRASGYRGPILSTKSNGGVMTARSAGQNPVETLFSGPASGVIGANYLAGLIGEPRIITLDMGGTSTDVSVLNGGYTYTTEASVGDLPVVLPAIDISSIGAGGGSIAWTDDLGVLKVGPRSAGANPGPACYGLGGREATLTDAYVALGIIDEKRFLGGAMVLQRDLAMRAMETIGGRLQLTPQEAAWSILEVATAKMIGQFAPLAARAGIDPRDFTIVAYGGAGPSHVLLLAREVGVNRVIIPPLPGGLCALGCLVADLRADFVRTWNRVVTATHWNDLAEILGLLEKEARAWVAREEIPVRAVRVERSVEMRYHGQSFEIPISWSWAGDLQDLLARFHDRYESIYGYADRNAAVEAVDLRVQVVGETAKPQLGLSPAGEVEARRGERSVFLDGTFTRAGVYDRAGLRPGDAVRGPAIVEQYDSTTLIAPGFDARVDSYSNLILEKR